MSRHNLFFTPELETGDFHSVLQQVQEYITGQHSELLSDGNANQAKSNIKRYIAKFVQDSRVAVKGMTQQQLVDALYTEMASKKSTSTAGGILKSSMPVGAARSSRNTLTARNIASMCCAGCFMCLAQFWMTNPRWWWVPLRKISALPS